MKIKPEHFEQIKTAIAKVIENQGDRSQAYRKEGFTPMRYRWDLLRASAITPSWVVDNIYPYANDDHMDTVLRKITKTGKEW